MSDMPDVTGLILVGGQNKRMNGVHKAFLELNGKTFLEHITSQLFDCRTIYLSVDDQNKFSYLGYPMVEDISKHHGPIGGIYSALKEIPADYLFVTGCDMPFISHEFVRYMTKQIREDIDCIALCDEAHRIYPVGAIYAKKMLLIIEELFNKGEYMLKKHVEAANSLIIPIGETPFNSNILININTPEEYEQCKSDFKSLHTNS